MLNPSWFIPIYCFLQLIKYIAYAVALCLTYISSRAPNQNTVQNLIESFIEYSFSYLELEKMVSPKGHACIMFGNLIVLEINILPPFYLCAQLTIIKDNNLIITLWRELSLTFLSRLKSPYYMLPQHLVSMSLL